MAELDRGALDRLTALIGDDPADLVDLMETFLQDAEELLAAFEVGVAAGDVVRAAHSLKSNARDFGATELALLCEQLENDLKTGETPDNLAARLELIRSLWPGVKSAIEHEIAATGVK